MACWGAGDIPGGGGGGGALAGLGRALDPACVPAALESAGNTWFAGGTLDKSVPERLSFGSSAGPALQPKTVQPPFSA